MSLDEEGERPNEARSIVASTIGGIMTQEAGAVTGDLEIASHPREEGIEVTVRYLGADEWYTVEGSPVGLGSAGGLSPSELRELHEQIVNHLTTPGMIAHGNEAPTSLRGFLP